MWKAAVWRTVAPSAAEPPPAGDEEDDMGRKVRIAGAASILLAPLTFGVGDQLRMLSETPAGGPGMGASPEYGVETIAARLADIQANPAPFQAAGWLAYAGVLLAIVALIAIWWLAVDRAPRWAWAAAVLATLGVIGQTVHLASYYALSQVLAEQSDLTAAAAVMLAAEENGFFVALFVPFLVGVLLAGLVQIVALRRARVVPLWSALAVVGGVVLMTAFGSRPWSSALVTALTVAAFAPAALAMLRTERRVEAAAPPAVAPRATADAGA
jgi:hypothetical protein